MRDPYKRLLAAGLVAGTALLTGCAAGTAPLSTTPPAQQATAEPATAAPATAKPEAEDEKTPEATQTALKLEVNGETVKDDAMEEQGKLLLPLTATAQALGWKAESSTTPEEMQTRRVITLDKDESRITVSWTVSDNTARNIVWQKDGLLIPVDTSLTTMGETVYVPAAFFEEAMGVKTARSREGVSVTSPKPMETDQITDDSSGENG